MTIQIWYSQVWEGKTAVNILCCISPQVWGENQSRERWPASYDTESGVPCCNTFSPGPLDRSFSLLSHNWFFRHIRSTCRTRMVTEGPKTFLRLERLESSGSLSNPKARQDYYSNVLGISWWICKRICPGPYCLPSIQNIIFEPRSHVTHRECNGNEQQKFHFPRRV